MSKTSGAQSFTAVMSSYVELGGVLVDRCKFKSLLRLGCKLKPKRSERQKVRQEEKEREGEMKGGGGKD